VGGIARENTVDLKAKCVEAEEGCKKNFVGGKCRIMNGKTKDWEEKETERGKCTKLEAEISL
jgi:hypothetical protein